MDYYLLIDNNSSDLTQIRTDCFFKHALATDNTTMLSEVIGRDNAERLIKVRGGDAAWLQSRSWAGSVIKHLTRGNTDDDNIRLAWCDAQDPNFDGNGDGYIDTPEERRAYWQNL